MKNMRNCFIKRYIKNYKCKNLNARKTYRSLTSKVTQFTIIKFFKERRNKIIFFNLTENY